MPLLQSAATEYTTRHDRIVFFYAFELEMPTQFNCSLHTALVSRLDHQPKLLYEATKTAPDLAAVTKTKIKEYIGKKDGAIL